MIIVTGDSWSSGEWVNCAVQHHGLAQYLHDHCYDVINLGRGKFSNSQAIEQLSYFLAQNSYQVKDISHVFFFQTEWTRDLEYLSEQEMQQQLKQGYQQLKDMTLYKIYSSLHFLCQKFGIRIYLIGGCSDVQWIDNCQVEYPGLTIACQSMTNLLLNNDHRTPNSVYTVFLQTDQNLIKYMKERISNDQLKLLLDDIDLSHWRLDTWKNNKKWFWPDGRHANRHGHKVLFDFLKSQGIFDQ